MVDYMLAEEKQMSAVNEVLHLSTAQTNVVCRENEQNRILDFCKKCVKEEKAGSLYVCGCPGTGKTLSMEKVKVMLVDWANEVLVLAPSEIGFSQSYSYFEYHDSYFWITCFIFHDYSSF